jgi:fatty acid desaturase
VFQPARFVGNVALGYLEYCSHYGVYSEEFGHDSVSAYGRVYNFFFFNNGLHAEHHLRPKAHWTTLYAVRAEMPPESERKVVSNFLLSPFSDAAPKQAPQSSVI